MMRTPSVGIVGMGWVGSSIAISTLHASAARHLLLHDIRAKVAEGEAMDLSHGSSFYSTATVESAPLERLGQCDAVVIAAGRAGAPEQTRLDLLKGNALVISALAEKFRGYEGIVVVVTNPVDVLTQVFQRVSALPPERVIGTGTMLDTARLRQALARELAMDPRSVHAQVIGEHGDSEVYLWSSANVGGTRVRDLPDWRDALEPTIEDEVRNAAYRIIERKGSTNHAIGLVTANLLRGMLQNERRVLTVSRVQEGATGIEGVALSLPAVVGIEGAVEVIEPDLDETEHAALVRSADIIAGAAADV